MIINNQLIHTHEIVSVLTNTLFEMSEKTYRIKFNGKFIRIKNKSEWDKIGSAKSAFKAYLRRERVSVALYLCKNSPTYYGISRSDLDGIYNQLIADNVLEFVEITNK